MVWVMVFNGTFSNISVTSVASWRWRELEYQEKTIDLLQIKNKLYHILLYDYKYFFYLIG
jgi:hypothetical protein